MVHGTHSLFFAQSFSSPTLLVHCCVFVYFGSHILLIFYVFIFFNQVFYSRPKMSWWLPFSTFSYNLIRYLLKITNKNREQRKYESLPDFNQATWIKADNLLLWKHWLTYTFAYSAWCALKDRQMLFWEINFKGCEVLARKKCSNIPPPFFPSARLTARKQNNNKDVGQHVSASEILLFTTFIAREGTMNQSEIHVGLNPDVNSHSGGRQAKQSHKKK